MPSPSKDVRSSGHLRNSSHSMLNLVRDSAYYMVPPRILVTILWAPCLTVGPAFRARKSPPFLLLCVVESNEKGWYEGTDRVSRSDLLRCSPGTACMQLAGETS